MARKHKSNPIFNLLIYRALAKRWLGPSLWLIPGGIVLWGAAAYGTFLDKRYAGLTLLVTLVGILLTTYNLLARRAAVRCHSKYFTVQTPIYPAAFSYRRVASIRPIEFNALFPAEKEKEARRQLYRGLWGKTAVAVDLKSYPVPLWWLRLWFSPYLLNPKDKGLLLLVDDWMALTRQLEIGRSKLVTTRHRKS